MTRPDNPTVVTAILTQDHLAVIDPAVPLLRPLLEYQVKDFGPGGPLGYTQVEETVGLWHLDFKGRLICPAGLLPRLRKVLEAHGYRVRVEDWRKLGPRLGVDEDVIDSSEGRDRALLEAVAREPLGRIEVRTAGDALDKMLLIGSLFPDAQCVVAVATRKEAWKTWRKLEEHLEENVGLALSGAEREGDHWLVGTFGSVPRDTEGGWDILFLPHAEEATGNSAAYMVAETGARRRNAFVLPQRRPDRHVQLRLEQIAGPVLHRVARPRVPVRVLMLPTPACAVAGATTALERKRTLYWHNRVRNEYVAAVAKAMVEGERAALRQVGLRNRDVRLLKDVDRTKIAVLVETPEHARKLVPLLPGWKALDLVPGGAAGGDNQNSGVKTPAVVTAAYAARHSVRVDILIRAAGTEWPLRVKGFPPKLSEKGPVEVLVVDLDDGFDPKAREDAERRVREYRRRGMSVRTPANP